MSHNHDGLRFRARVQESDAGLPCLDLPGQVSRALKAPRDADHPVRVVIGGVVFETRLEVRDDGLHRLNLPEPVWLDLHAKLGDLLVGRIRSRDAPAA